MARPQPPQQPPPVQRLRLRYVKRGVARFASHRDFSRALERALRRAEVPMAYSSGYSPHPRISYVGAAPTGAASEAEYVELGLAEVCDPEKVLRALNQTLPEGFRVVQVVAAGGRPLPERLQASLWRIEIPGVSSQGLAAACELLRASDEVTVTRMTKKGERRFNARAPMRRIDVVDGAVQVVLQHTEPLVRPDDVVAALGLVAPDVFAAAAPERATRLQQGPIGRGPDGRVVVGDALTECADGRPRDDPTPPGDV